MLPDAAAMVVVPAASAEACPVPSIAATVLFEEVQVTDEVRF